MAINGIQNKVIVILYITFLLFDFGKWYIEGGYIEAEPDSDRIFIQIGVKI